MKIKLPLIFQVLNLLVVLGALGFMVYSKLIFKRPVITENSEKKRLEALFGKKKVMTPVTTRGYIHFPPVTINIQSVPKNPNPAPGTSHQMEGKLHYATVEFSIEVRDQADTEKISSLKTFIQDQLGLMLGKRSFQELISVQGRYILASDLVSTINQLVSAHMGRDTATLERETMTDPWVTRVYFTNFQLQ